MSPGDRSSDWYGAIIPPDLRVLSVWEIIYDTTGFAPRLPLPCPCPLHSLTLTDRFDAHATISPSDLVPNRNWVSSPILVPRIDQFLFLGRCVTLQLFAVLCCVCVFSKKDRTWQVAAHTCPAVVCQTVFPFSLCFSLLVVLCAVRPPSSVCVRRIAPSASRGQ